MIRYNNVFIAVIILLLTACASTSQQSDSIDEQLNFNNKVVFKVELKIKKQYSVALNYLKVNKVNKAQKILEDIATKSPGLPGVHLNLALLYYHLKYFKRSRTELNKVFKVSNKNELAYNLSGSLYRQAGQFTLAKNSYSRSLKLVPDYADAHLNIAILFDIYLQNWTDAKQHYLRYLDLSNNNTKQVKLWLQDLELRMSKGT